MDKYIVNVCSVDDMILENVRSSLVNNLDLFKNMSADEIFNSRKNKFLKIGRSKGFITNLEELSSLKKPDSQIYNLLKSKRLIVLSLLFISIFISLFLFL